MADSVNNSKSQVQNCTSITNHNSSSQGGSRAKCAEPTCMNGGRPCEEIHVKEIHQLSEDDLQLFSHQVAGHGTDDKGFIKDKLGHVLKPLQGPPKGTREVNFYKAVFKNSSDDCYSKLQEFVPKFHGVASLNRNKDAASPTDPKLYLMMDDALEGFKKKCVVDLKIGPQTWSPDASEAKIKQESSKYKGTKFPVGICLTGVISYDVEKNLEMYKVTRDIGKTLNPDTLKETMRKFFNHSKDHQRKSNILSSTLLKCTRIKLQKIKEVFDTQKSFRLYGSSLLIAYDAEFFENSQAYDNQEMNGEGDFPDQNNVPLRVFMIDFAHFHPGEYETVDENYLFGLNNLIKIICDIEENK